MRAAQLYAADHPLVGAQHRPASSRCSSRCTRCRRRSPIGIVGSDLVVVRHADAQGQLGDVELIKRLKDNKIERIAFERGVTQDELARLCTPVAPSASKRRRGDATCRSPHIRVGRHHEEDDKKQDGIGGDIAAIRQMYSNAGRIGRSAVGKRSDGRHARSRPARCRPSKASPTPSRRTARR